MDKYYITTAIAYTSRTPHIGNTYEAVLADAIARYHRKKGEDVFFLTGTDEHGQKIQHQAKSEGITPKEHVDKIAAEAREIWDLMDVSYDKFIRTTDKEHMKTVQDIFKKLYDKGDIYLSSYEGMYCEPCESFYLESALVDGKCPSCGANVVKTKEEAYFFALNKYCDRLIKYIEDNPQFIQPESRKNEMLNNFLKPGLSDLCVSRTSFDWGVPVSFDPKHVVYVWIDALTNYISALGYDVNGNHGDLFKKYWPADVHLIGKDILRFHTIYWPIILMALDVELPKQVFGHPWLLFSDDKMSKSKGNVVYAKELCERFGVDATRYYMLHEMPFAQDGNFTYPLMIQRYNSDLCNILGNLVSRTVAMAEKYFDGVIPQRVDETEFDKELVELCESTYHSVDKAMKELRVADAIDEIWTLLRRSNKYIDETMPWVLAKNEADRGKLQTVIYNLLECIRVSAVLLEPFLPQTAKKIFGYLNTEKTSFESILKFGEIEAGNKLNKAQALFLRIDEEKMLAEIEAASSKPQTKEKPEGIELISIDDFAKTELRVGKIIDCEKVEKSDKLLKLYVDLGYEKRQVVSGIAKFYKPEDITGKKIILVSNLQPVKLRGVLSEGMILAADSNDEIKVIFVDDSVETGSKIR